jgi:hypothetical protein
VSDAAADYRAWKASVTDALDRLRGISASIVPEHVWTGEQDVHLFRPRVAKKHIAWTTQQFLRSMQR